MNFFSIFVLMVISYETMDLIILNLFREQIINISTNPV
jgi:hypothetical protein